MRRSPKVAGVLPVMYRRGSSTGDLKEALTLLLGENAAGLSSTNIAHLTNEWDTEYRVFKRHSLDDRDDVTWATACTSLFSLRRTDCARS